MREYSVACVDLCVLDVSNVAVNHVLCPYLCPIVLYTEDNFTRFAIIALTEF